MTFVLAILLSLVSSAALAAEQKPLRVVSVRASSTLPKYKGYTFVAANLVDGRVDTSWQPAKNDTLGVGQWFEVDLGATYAISAIELDSGLQKDDPELGDLFCKNNRPTSVYVFFDDGTHAWLHRAQERTSRTEARMFSRGEERSGSGRTRRLRFVVTEAERPVEWDDLAIAEVRVFGTPAADVAPPVGDVACGGPGMAPFIAAITEHCNVARQTRLDRACKDLLARYTLCYSHVGYASFDAQLGYPEGDPVIDVLAPIPAAAIATGKVALTWQDRDFTRVALDFALKDGEWRVARHRRTDADGKAPPPTGESLYGGAWRQNACWHKLGKTPPEH